jgi:hypothetical protein
MLVMQPDWFANLTGFRETSYDATREQLVVEGDELVSTVNGKRYGTGPWKCRHWPTCAVAWQC